MNSVISQLLFPHYCCYCSQIGNILCGSCYNDIVEEANNGLCVVCRRPCTTDGVCRDCLTSFTKAWVVGNREDALSALIDESKYHSRREGCQCQAALLDDVLPQLPTDIRVVPVPTIQTHIRQRGYGHSELIAKEFARRRKLNYQPYLRRVGKYVQQGSPLKDRIAQAKVSYEANSAVKGKQVLLVDDVYTTGSTTRYAAQALIDAGAKEVWLALTARQTLDD